MTAEDYLTAPHHKPPAGPCAFCGYPDKRHRMWDMIRGRFAAGESIADLAKDYGQTPLEIEQWLRLAITAPGKGEKSCPRCGMPCAATATMCRNCYRVHCQETGRSGYVPRT